MKYKYAIFIYLISVFLNPVLSSQEVSENKISLELNKLFFTGRNIKETNQTYHNENAYHYYKRYNEENSFLEINLREIMKENNYFSHYNIIDFISKPQFEIMDKLLAKNISDIFTFLDEDSQRFFYYRLFENKNFKNEKCFIFVVGHEKGENNFYNKIINGVGCSTELKFNNILISKLFKSIQINNLPKETDYENENLRFKYDNLNNFKSSLINFGKKLGIKYNQEIINGIIEQPIESINYKNILNNKTYEKFVSDNPSQIFNIIEEAKSYKNKDKIIYFSTQAFLRIISFSQL